MVIDGELLLIVADVQLDAARGEYNLLGFDFGAHFGHTAGSLDTTRTAVAISKSAAVNIVSSDLRCVHRFGEGWKWISRDVDRFPERPFLLTNDSNYCMIYSGDVSVAPLPDVRSLILGGIEYHGAFESPIIGSGWIGWLVISSREVTRGSMLAFSNELGALPAQCDDVSMPDSREDFGTIRADM
jgi:hypothetical protein